MLILCKAPHAGDLADCLEQRCIAGQLNYGTSKSRGNFDHVACSCGPVLAETAFVHLMRIILFVDRPGHSEKVYIMAVLVSFACLGHEENLNENRLCMIKWGSR